MQNPVVGLYERGRFNVSCYPKVYLGAGARKAEVDGFDKEGALLVALPSSHSLAGGVVGKSKRF